MTNFFSHLFDFERPDSVGQRLFYRLFELMIGYWVILFAWTWGAYLPTIEDVILPLGVANYIDVSFMFDGPWGLVNAGVMTATFILGFTRTWRFGYVVCILSFHLQYASRYSLGEISHGSNVIGVVLVGMALAAWAFRDDLTMRRFTLGFAYFFLGLGYTSAAACKLIASGPMWVDGAHMWMWIMERSVDTLSITGTGSVNFLQQMALDSRPLATLILTYGLLTEACGILIWFKKTRTPVMLALFAMHVGILLSMNINFPANNALLIALALPWDRYLDRLLDNRAPEPLVRLAHRIAGR